MAVRYYAKNGDTFNYLGGSYTKENKPENDADLIMQTFLFSTETKTVSVMSVGNGTASRETEEFLKHQTFRQEIQVFVVSEQGASI